MKQRLKITILPLLLFFSIFTSRLRAEEKDSTYGSFINRISISVAMGNHTIGFPFQNLYASFNPVLFDGGAELKLNKKKKSFWYTFIGTCIVRNNQIGHSVMPAIGIGYRWFNKSNYWLSAALETGAIVQFHPTQTFIYNKETNAFKHGNNTPFLSQCVGFSLSVGYNLSVKYDIPLSVMIKNRFFIQSTYFNLASFPIMPQNMMETGIIYSF